jgi:hypothetical protein
MKIPYSSFSYFRDDEISALEKKQPMVAIKNLMSVGLDAKSAIAELSYCKTAMYGHKIAKAGNCTHYFFKGAGFYNWLEQAAPPLTDEHMAIISELCGKDKVVMFHYEGGLAPCYLAFIVKSIDYDMSEHGDRLFISSGKNSRIVYSSPGHETDDYEILKPTKIVAASMAYILAFPEMITDGIPDDLRHPNHYRKARAKTVGMSPEIIERDGPSPHFRVGHFRHLTSERYKTKRGQTVFVRGTFVKGKAATVLSPDGK